MSVLLPQRGWQILFVKYCKIGLENTPEAARFRVLFISADNLI